MYVAVRFPPPYVIERLMFEPAEFRFASLSDDWSRDPVYVPADDAPSEWYERLRDEVDVSVREALDEMGVMVIDLGEKPGAETRLFSRGLDAILRAAGVS